MAKRTERDKTPRRRRPSLEPRDRILVLCCGTTEKEYFEQLREAVRNPSVSVKVKQGSQEPRRLAREGVTLPERDRFDQVWCIADVDQYDIEPAQRIVDEDPKARLAVSNPCFELWLLLHFRDWNKFENECVKLGNVVREHVAGYDKHVDFRRFKPGLAQAITRAKDLRSSDSRVKNPSTDVWEVVEAVVRGAGPTVGQVPAS